MVKYYYQKKKDFKKIFRILSLLILGTGIALMSYVFLPLISWQIYFAPVFASQDIAIPIPKATIVNDIEIKSLISQATQNLSGVDFNNPKNWFSNFNTGSTGKPRINSYDISIPAINIKNANVTTIDNDLAHHLVNYQGTAVPPDNGNAVIFGHSTLPQLFNPKDYKTIFANAYRIKTGDEIFVNSEGVSFKYKVFNITVVDPEDTSALAQNYKDSFLTIVTCTPPGTIWKRLIVKARLEKI